MTNDPAVDETWEIDEDDLLGTYERQAVQSARVDPICFFEYVFDWSCQQLHEEWQDLCSDFDRLLIRAPTDHGKTSQISYGRALWELGRDPTLRIALVSNTARLGVKTLGAAKQTILLNRKLAKVFPWLRPERRPGRTAAWSEAAIIVERDNLTLKDPSIQALGTIGAFVGARVDLMIFDDILNRDNTATELQRKKVIEWIENTAIGRMTASARWWVIGTPWFEDDALHWIASKEEFAVAEYDADDHLWPEPVYDEKGRVVAGWPEWRLAKRREELGPVEYARQMKCKALTDTMAIFNVAKFDACVRLDGRTLFPEIYRGSDLLGPITGVDLGIKKGQEHDETVLFTAGLAPGGIYQLISIVSLRGELPEILRAIVDVYRRYGPIDYVVEDVQAQAYVVQFIERHEEILEIIGAEAVESVLKHIRITPFTTAGSGKYSKHDPLTGIRSMTVEFDQEKWRIQDNAETRAWRAEMKRYTPSAKAGDRLMASWFCWGRLRNLARRGKLRAASVGSKRPEVVDRPAVAGRGPIVRRIRARGF